LLLGFQRDLGSHGGAVLEGRDIGTVVFPDAEFKFFVTASVDERAKRRMSELAAGGQNVPLEDVRQAIIERDHSDSTRAIAPLKQAADARLIDTTSMTVDEVIDTLERIIRSHA
jgi:cytidylate kinase